MLKSTLASIALGMAALQVLLALWIYRKLPLAASPPRPVRLAHRIIGLALFALTVPIALHCLIAYGVQLTSVRVAVHSPAGCFFYGAFVARVLLVQSRRLPGWTLPVAGARSLSSSSASSGTPPRSGTTTATGSLACSPHRAYFTEDTPAAEVAGSVLHTSVHQMATPAAHREDEPVHRPAAGPERGPARPPGACGRRCSRCGHKGIRRPRSPMFSPVGSGSGANRLTWTASPRWPPRASTALKSRFGPQL